MKKSMLLLFLLASCSSAEEHEICNSINGGKLCTPPTSLQFPLNDMFATKLKHKDYTNYTIFVPNKTKKNTSFIETPASLACIYGLTPNVPGCPINGTTAVPKGGSGYIGIIDRNYSATLVNDFNTFSQQYGLPTCTGTNNPATCESGLGSCFQVINITGSGTCPPDTTDHGGEQHIDVEWSHAMAPNANIILFMGDDNMTIEQMAQAASARLAALGGGILSISLSGPEFPTELDSDSAFQTPGIVYVVSAGDNGPPARYPSSSPYVIAAGGTMVIRDNNGNFVEEQAWNINGGIGAGGPSQYEPRPTFQNGVQKIVGNSRGVPDIAFAAYQLSIYNSTPGSACMNSGHGWCGANGTSISAPALAGVINAAGRKFNSSQEALTYIYTEAAKNYHIYWNDIVKGSNGYPARPGYDFCTGLGTPRGYGGK